MRFKEMLQWQKVSGKPVVANGITVTPESRVLIVRLPRMMYVWNRPTAVLVEQDGRKELRPIVDASRTIQLVVAALSIAIAIGRLILFVQRKERNKEHD